MPVDSESGTPTLPYTYRPFGARIATAVAAAAIVFIVTFLWVLLPGDVQNDFSTFQRITLIGFFVAVLAILNAIFRTHARADERGLSVVNGYRRHELEWGQIVRISLTPNRPWALMDLDDGSTLSVMAIQSSDGARAKRSARLLAVMIARQTRTDHNT
jgi:hypothetical protein